MIPILLSWAAHLSSYAYPATAPQLQYRGHEYFVEHACGGQRNCKAAAWYDDHDVIYLDDRIEDLEDPVVRSVIVHELVHYLQDLSGKFVSGSCQDQVAREREAYAIQRKYLVEVAGRFGALYPMYGPCQN